MKRIASFKVNHELLTEGIYISRVDRVGFANYPITTFDIRCVRPNNPTDSYMSIQAMHTIEHLGATFFRNYDFSKDPHFNRPKSMIPSVVYFGAMGCQTGFYLILSGEFKPFSDRFRGVVSLIEKMFSYIVNFNDKEKIPGASKIECGNYKSHNLREAKLIAANFLVMYRDFGMLEFAYRTGNFQYDKELHEQEEIFIKRPIDRENQKIAKENGFIAENSSLFSKEELMTEEEILKNPIQRYERDDVSVLFELPDSLKEIRRAGEDSSTALF